MNHWGCGLGMGSLGLGFGEAVLIILKGWLFCGRKYTR